MQNNCNTCKYSNTFDVCTAPRALRGLPFRDVTLQRADNWLVARVHGTCGKEGRFYEKRYSSETSL